MCHLVSDADTIALNYIQIDNTHIPSYMLHVTRYVLHIHYMRMMHYLWTRSISLVYSAIQSVMKQSLQRLCCVLLQVERKSTAQ